MGEFSAANAVRVNEKPPNITSNVDCSMLILTSVMSQKYPYNVPLSPHPAFASDEPRSRRRESAHLFVWEAKD